METGLITVLAATPAIAGGRVYPRIPQRPTFPLIRYQRINTTRTNGIDGTNLGPTQFTIQIDCMAKTYADSKTLAAAVLERLNGYRGAWGSSTCRFCTIQTENDFYEQEGDDVTHWVSQRFLIWTNDN